jgi:hypothetical protein
VNFDLPITNKSQIGKEILTYLVEQPEAQDTVDGIVEWWLLERQIKFQTARVKEVISKLVDRGWVIRVQRIGSNAHYRINHDKYKEIQAFLGI